MVNKNEENTQNHSQSEKKPDESSGIQVDEFIQIFDPESGKVFVAKRGES